MRTKSIWGLPPKRIYKLIKIAEESLDKKFSTCIVGCSDGKFLMPFARKGYEVTGYEIDEIAIYGGSKNFPKVNELIRHKYQPGFRSKSYEIEKKEIMGLKKRLEFEGIEKLVNIETRDFYKMPNIEKFDVVFTSCSLHYSNNENITLQEKTNALQDIVKDKGFLYMDYMMAIDDNKKFSKAKFFRKGEILEYFNDHWDIISIREQNKPVFEGAHVDFSQDHFHRFGYLLARKGRP